MAVVTVQTENGPVLVDEENIEAWSGKPASEFTLVGDAAPKPKRGKKTADAPDVPKAENVVKNEDGKFYLVDANNVQVGDAVYETEEAAWEAALGA